MGRRAKSGEARERTVDPRRAERSRRRLVAADLAGCLVVMTRNLVEAVPTGSTFVGRLRSRVLAAALASALVPMVPGPASGQEAEGPPDDPVSFTGRVIDVSTGLPLQGAWVGLEGASQGTITNERGLFLLPGIPPGPRVFSFEMLGYATLNLTADAAVNRDATVSLVPDPVLLEGIEVVADRFESRRRGVASSVETIPRNRLLNATAPDVLEFLKYRYGIRRVPCTGPRSWDRTLGLPGRASVINATITSECAWVRGKPTAVTVCIDERPMAGGIDFLTNYPLEDLYLMEIYGGGGQIRLYTNRFMELAGRTRLNPTPLAGSFC
jgi:hypothetical protein